MLHVGVGASRKLRRLTPAERWALVAGAWALAAESPRRGSLLIAEGLPVTVEDVAEHAGVPNTVARKALDKARSLSLLVSDEEGVEWIHDWHDWNPDPKPSDSPEATRARKQKQRAQATGHAAADGGGHADVPRDTERDISVSLAGPFAEGKLKETTDPPKPPQGGRARDLEQYRTDCASYAAEHFPDLGEQGREAVRQATSGPDRAASHGAVVEFVDRWWRKTWRDPAPAEERVA